VSDLAKSGRGADHRSDEETGLDADDDQQLNG
jgi:hypothetical protein